MAELRPREFSPRAAKARCLYYLGRLKESLAVWDSLLDETKEQYRHGNLLLGIDMAGSLSNRAGVYSDYGDQALALMDVSAAISMYRLLQQKIDSPAVWLDLAKTLNRRAGVYADLGRYESGLRDYDAAKE